MKSRDYKCNKCNKIIEIWVKDDETFPDNKNCECGGILNKKFSIPSVHCSLGSVGNATNGYTNTGGYIKRTKMRKE